MTRQRILNLVVSLSFSTLALGTVGCSNGQGPTEPAFDDLSDKSAVSGELASTTDELSSATDKRRGRGGDDSSDDRGRGRGSDDGAGDDRGRGNDDSPGDDRGGRGQRGGNDDDNNNNNNRPRTGQEFEGSVSAVNGNTVILSGGTRVVVNGQTQWIARGDLSSLSQVARSVSAGRATRVEGRGTRQNDGSVVALTIKAEVDN